MRPCMMKLEKRQVQGLACCRLANCRVRTLKCPDSAVCKPVACKPLYSLLFKFHHASLSSHCSYFLLDGMRVGALDPRTLEPHNLAAIYRGCPNPPAHLREALGLPPLQQQPPRRNSTNSQQQQRPYSISQASGPNSQVSGGGTSQGQRQSSGNTFVQCTGSSGSQVCLARRCLSVMLH